YWTGLISSKATSQAPKMPSQPAKQESGSVGKSSPRKWLGKSNTAGGPNGSTSSRPNSPTSGGPSPPPMTRSSAGRNPTPSSHATATSAPATRPYATRGSGS